MNSSDDTRYRLGLGNGFLKEAEQDFQLRRWRSCVANAQLSVENHGKAILTIFGLSPKTHEPARHLAKLIQKGEMPEVIADRIKDVLPDLLMLGTEEHFMTDYGDESGYKLPWDIFDEGSAASSLEAARRSKKAAEEIVKTAHSRRSDQKK